MSKVPKCTASLIQSITEMNITTLIQSSGSSAFPIHLVSMQGKGSGRITGSCDVRNLLLGVAAVALLAVGALRLLAVGALRLLTVGALCLLRGSRRGGGGAAMLT